MGKKGRAGCADRTFIPEKKRNKRERKRDGYYTPIYLSLMYLKIYLYKQIYIYIYIRIVVYSISKSERPAERHGKRRDRTLPTSPFMMDRVIVSRKRKKTQRVAGGLHTHTLLSFPSLSLGRAVASLLLLFSTRESTDRLGRPPFFLSFPPSFPVAYKLTLEYF